MTPALLAPILALGLVFQSSPPSGAAGSGGRAGAGGTETGSGTSRATVKKRGHDLADLLAPLAGSAQRTEMLAPPSPPNRGDVQVSSPSAAAQFGPMVVVDPTDRTHLVAAATDLRDSQIYAAFYASFDEGKTWSETLVDNASAPSAAFGADGSLYLVSTQITGDRENSSTNLFYARSYDGGLTTTDWTQITFGGSLSYADEATILVDTTGGAYDGRIYIVYTEGGEGFDTARVLASADGGATWVNEAVSDAPTAIHPTAAIDAHGVLCVAFLRFDSWVRGIDFDSSSDGGATFGIDVPITDVGSYSVPGFTFAFFPMPAIAIDTSGSPFQDALYVAWTQDGGGTPDAVFAKSSDHGATWSAPVLASDVAGGSQYGSAIAVDSQGTVDFSFFDARDDTHNRRVHRYVSRSSDGGASILPNVKISRAAFDPSLIDIGSLVSGREGLAASDRLVQAIWTDGRNGDTDVFANAANLDCFTDLATISAATGGTASFTVDPGPIFQLTEYHVLGSLSGITPGTDFYFENVPINFDLFTLATIYEANGPIFPGFTGNLDTAGAATAQLVSGPLPPALIGVQMDFAALVRVGGAVRWGSAPTRVEIGN